MTVSTYNPHELTMTPPAVAHVKKQLARHGASALLLDITESGCNGYMYELSYLDGRPDDARAFDFDGVTVLVAGDHWPLVQGMEIDYVTEGLNAMLKFKNPNATAECGCGESFSIK